MKIIRALSPSDSLIIIYATSKIMYKKGSVVVEVAGGQSRSERDAE